MSETLCPFFQEPNIFPAFKNGTICGAQTEEQIILCCGSSTRHLDGILGRNAVLEVISQADISRVMYISDSIEYP